MKQQTAEEVLHKVFDWHNNDPNSKLSIIDIEIAAMRAYAAPFQQTITEHEATIENLASTVVEQESKLEVAVKALAKVHSLSRIPAISEICNKALEQIKTKE